MQTPKGRNCSIEVPQKRSPATPRTVRQLKTPGSDSGSIGISPQANKTPKERSPKVAENKSPRTPITELQKKRQAKIPNLEAQLKQLQEELKKTKDHLSTSESWKRRAQQEAEETNKQLVAMSVKLEKSQQQMLELSDSEEARLQELRQISQDRDRVWQSELEAVQKQHFLDSSALASAMNEIQKLKAQLERLSESEAVQARNAESAHVELQNLRVELTETLNLVEQLKTELAHCRESEAQAQEIVQETQMQLETANTTVAIIQSEGIKAMEACNSLSQELEESRSKIISLESLVSQLQSDGINLAGKDIINITSGEDNGVGSNQLKEELKKAKLEAEQLRSALDAADIRYQEENIQSTLKIRTAYELVEETKSECCWKERKLEDELKKANAEIEALKANLMDKDTEMQNISAENEGLNLKIDKNAMAESGTEHLMDLKKLEADIAEIKGTLLDKETALQSISEENELLKKETKKNEEEARKVNEANSLAEAARAAEQEALEKLGRLTEEADKNGRRVAHVTEQLEAAQVAQSEMEAEMRRLKVQSDQWRKAAEAAAAMLSNGNNGKCADRTTLNNNLNPFGGNLESRYLDDMDDDSPKKKNTNMMKKIGVLWKKGPK